jgi:hypothetical protein
MHPWCGTGLKEGEIGRDQNSTGVKEKELLAVLRSPKEWA